MRGPPRGLAVVLCLCVRSCVCQFGDFGGGGEDFDSIISAMLSATPEPTPSPTAAPTKPPTQAPTYHTCEDGSHGCEQVCISDAATLALTGKVWRCACREGYTVNLKNESACQATPAPTQAPSPDANFDPLSAMITEVSLMLSDSSLWSVDTSCFVQMIGQDGGSNAAMAP